MKSLKKIIAIILCLTLVSGIVALCSYAASPRITGIRIVTLPVRTVFYQEEDWVYGVWDTSESTGQPVLIQSDKISFTHNPCGGRYPERGMLDMTGLVIEVSYSDGTKTNMTYKETKGKAGYTANIMFSPKGGKGFFIGTNTIEVYLLQNTQCYDSYDIQILEEKEEVEPFFKVKDGSNVEIDSNNFVMGVPANLTLSQLQNDIFDYENVEVSFSKVSRAYKYYGTGSTVTVKYPDGSKEIYTLVVEGDVDGSGIIDSSDIGLVSLAIINNDSLNRAQFLAANVDGMRKITENDLAIITILAASNSAS